MVMPLDGIRVLDLTRLLPGAVATMMLADLGADVIKIEDPNGGDYARWMSPQFGGNSAFFNVNNRNKRSMILDLKAEDGPDTLRRLVATADVLIEGFRPGVLAKFGCDYESLRVVNPRLVYCGLYGWGADGPMAQTAGHDLNYVAMAGLTDAADIPQVIGGQIADIGGAYIAVSGILAALFRRERTGIGGFLDVSMSEAALPFNIYSWTEAVTADVGGGEGHLTGGLAYYRIYTASDGVPVALAALEPKFWSNFCLAVGKPEWTAYHAQTAKQPELRALLTELFASRPAAVWDELLGGADCCFSVVTPLAEVHESAQYQARRALDVGADGQPWMRSPIRIDGGFPPLGPIPGYGEHTEQIMMELRAADEIDS
jgi:crotonobetainyl-CoA:carnitine CoA-transferase CaiB-like acyl-CoA transferase